MKKIGLGTGVATSVGMMLIASAMLTISQGLSIGGYLFIVGLVISFVIVLCQATSFSELSGMIPTEGSVYDYVTAGLGRFWGMTATLAAYIIVTAFACSAEVAAAGIFAQKNFSTLNSLIPTENAWIISEIIILACIALNIFGLSVYAKAEIILSYSKWIIMMCIGILGVLAVPKIQPEMIWGASMIGDNWEALFTMVSFSLFLFVGVEYITPLAPEMEDAPRNIPRSILYGMLMCLVGMLLYATGITRQVPNEVIDAATNTRLYDTPESIAIFGNNVLGELGKFGISLAVFIATIALVNTIIAGIPRILYGMAQDGMLPSAFGKLHSKYQTPWVGILFIGAIPAIGAYLVGGNTQGVFQLLLAAVCSWIFFYILINISVVLLRRRRPDLARPYKIPFYPLPQIIATLGLLITFWYIAPPFLTRQDIYLPFGIMLLICAIFSFIWIKYVAKMEMWKTVDVEEILKK